MISEEEINFYKSILHELDTVFDVGCRDDNVFEELKPGIEIHLFDPVKRNSLMEKIAGKSNIKFNNIGLGDVKTKVTFHPSYGSILLRDDEPKFTDHSETIIEVDTVESYCRLNDIKWIDFLKIDTEGYDLNVIKGCGYMIYNIHYIQFEDWTPKLTREIIQYLPPRKLIDLGGKPKNFVAVLTL
jgi:FkbM family methyltransferase